MRIAVFAKAPVPGEVKTRLAPLLGPDGAAALHAGLVRRTLAMATQARPRAVDLWCAPTTADPFFERCAAEFGVTLQAQAGEDLGERMGRAIATGLRGADAVVVIGCDCPVLGVADLEEAFGELQRHPVVIAPAEDGGYVLVGMTKLHEVIFRDIDWGTAAVMGQTRARLAAGGIEWHELPTRWDVDRPADHARLQAEGLLPEILS